MATRLVSILLGVILSVAISNMAHVERFAHAAELDEKGEAQAKEATRLYKQGQYEEAAKIFAQLSVEHPDMPIFERNMGACFYYLKKPEPALSNLRNYLHHKKDIAPDDKVVVDRWIEEMEKLRAQGAAALVEPPASAEAPLAPRPHLDEVATTLPGSVAPAVRLPAPQPQPAVPQPSGGSAIGPPVSQPVLPQGPTPVPAGRGFPQTASGEVPPKAPWQSQPSTSQGEISSAEQSATGTTNGTGLRFVGIACGALGLASIGAAVYYYTRATTMSDRVTSGTPASAADFQAGKDAETMQWVFYSVGGGAVATGLVLYLLGWSASTKPASVGVSPIAAPGIAGLSAHGGF